MNSSVLAPPAESFLWGLKSEVFLCGKWCCCVAETPPCPEAGPSEVWGSAGCSWALWRGAFLWTEAKHEQRVE